MRGARISPLARGLVSLAGLSTLGLLAGCGAGAARQVVPGPAFQGSVHGGQQPVSGASIQLYAAGTGGYGSAASPLLSTAVSSDANGNFSISHLYSCPPNSQVYLVASGGNPGLASGTNNAALALMVALGPCGNLTPSTFVNIDEVTTVASVYSLAQFMSSGGGTKLGTSSGNALGLANAFATVNNLVNTASGRAPGPNLPTGATAPSSELNTLADLLATCVNTDGTTGECSALLAAARPSGGNAPTNTIDAILDIALNPGQNVTTLYNLLPGGSPFQPTLGSAPNDWTVDLRYFGGGIHFPFSLVIDGEGNVWTGNIGASDHLPSLSKFSPTGAGLSPPDSGYVVGEDFDDIALDTMGNVWIPNIITNGLMEFSNAGDLLSPLGGYTGGGLSLPFGVAVDGSDNIWVNNRGGLWSLSKFANDGTPLSPASGFSGGGLNQPFDAIAIDSDGNVWSMSNGTPACLVEFSNSGSPISPSSGYTGGGLVFSYNLGIDASGDVWVPGGLSEFSKTGIPLSPASGYGAGGGSRFLAVDGAGHIWLPGGELSNSGVNISTPIGYPLPGAAAPAGIAVDPSGNVWVADESTSSLYEVVGAAAPVMTPLAAAVKNGKLGQRP